MDFFADYLDYSRLTYDMDDMAIADFAFLHLKIQDTPEYKQLLRLFHSLVMECTRGEYQPYCTIAHFLGEGFNRFHNSLNG